MEYKISKEDWTRIGKETGWLKKADAAMPMWKLLEIQCEDYIKGIGNSEHTTLFEKDPSMRSKIETAMNLLHDINGSLR